MLAAWQVGEALSSNHRALSEKAAERENRIAEMQHHCALLQVTSRVKLCMKNQENAYIFLAR